MTELLLYGTSGCHLCEQAEELLEPVLAHINEQLVNAGMGEAAVILRALEITDDPELMQRYSLRIPVIRLAESEVELGWPFDELQAWEFLLTQLE
ncbi:MAG: glutaredoxin family protein [Gammaproteobacteria bacterium]|nr:glutaredoxin family protein [Gammaproteobacteria bacterium]